MKSKINLTVVIAVAFAFTLPAAESVEVHRDFDVVIAGGSTAALAAAVSAAECGARVALLEPTDWIGGQLTSSGVPAIDEAWHSIKDSEGRVMMNVAAIARTPANISPHLRRMLDATGCPGKCWVSRYCFEPRDLLRDHLEPLERSLPQLTVFRETVVKSATVTKDRITGLTAIQRVAKPGVDGYEKLPSSELVDWYSSKPSERFQKRILKFEGDSTVFIDATEWGELLVLSGAPYLVGVENEDGGLVGDDSYGQSITYGFVQKLHRTNDSTRDANLPNPKLEHLGMGEYRERDKGWDLIWTYRRLRATKREPSVGDLSLQNWNYFVDDHEGGNDYPFGYLFLGQEASQKQASSGWMGGVDLDVLAAAEKRAYAWHHWFKSAAPAPWEPEQISLDCETLGARHGLSKLPYIRDTRRSIGIDDFLLTVNDLRPEAPGKLAKTFEDRIALGAYPVDIHPMADRNYPNYIFEDYDIAPFTIPYRSLTNKRFTNLLVAGKTMAQSFLANSATRLHPTEWSTGTAAGVAAAMMIDERVNAHELTSRMAELQKAVSQKTPIDWTLKNASTN